MRKISIGLILLVFAVSPVLASDFDFWETLYPMAVAPKQEVSVDIECEKSQTPLINLELEKPFDPGYPLRAAKIEFDRKNVRATAVILKRSDNGQDSLKITYRPAKLSPGYHALIVRRRDKREPSDDRDREKNRPGYEY